ncbi:hypothetical protein ACFSM5_18110 [Lacibacterium aquatile]|uniref:Uncharacterized protein n=1 Tax=Lacibacterium aquatile TaxID=1168082 RepID=A0ABW5DXX3_9PROT
MRIVIIILIPLLVPFLLYSIWSWYRGQKGLPAPTDGPPTIWLVVAGVGLLLLTLAAFSIQSTEGVGGTYVPPSVRPDGTFEPGHVIR